MRYFKCHCHIEYKSDEECGAIFRYDTETGLVEFVNPKMKIFDWEEDTAEEYENIKALEDSEYLKEIEEEDAFLEML